MWPFSLLTLSKLRQHVTSAGTVAQEHISTTTLLILKKFFDVLLLKNFLIILCVVIVHELSRTIASYFFLQYSVKIFTEDSDLGPAIFREFSQTVTPCVGLCASIDLDLRISRLKLSMKNYLLHIIKAMGSN